jgi:hypothetical protein
MLARLLAGIGEAKAAWLLLLLLLLRLLRLLRLTPAGLLRYPFVLMPGPDVMGFDA